MSRFPGRLPGVLPTGNFGSKTEERFEVLKKYTEAALFMCTEFWVGWFDHWGNGGHMLAETWKKAQKIWMKIGNGTCKYLHV